MVYHANDVIDLAGPCYERALAGNERDALRWYLLALVQTELGEVDAAIASLTHCEQLAPELIGVGLIREDGIGFPRARQRDIGRAGEGQFEPDDLVDQE